MEKKMYKDYIMRQVALFSRCLGQIMFRRNVPDAQIEFLKYDEVASASPLWASVKALVAKGQINEAENLLFETVTVERSQENLAAALCFYELLLRMLPEQLRAADFSLAEIEQGLNDIAELYDFTQM